MYAPTNTAIFIDNISSITYRITHLTPELDVLSTYTIPYKYASTISSAHNMGLSFIFDAATAKTTYAIILEPLTPDQWLLCSVSRRTRVIFCPVALDARITTHFAQFIFPTGTILMTVDLVQMTLLARVNFTEGRGLFRLPRRSSALAQNAAQIIRGAIFALPAPVLQTLSSPGTMRTSSTSPRLFKCSSAPLSTSRSNTP